MKDNCGTQNTRKILERIRATPYRFDETDTNSVLEFLYQAYADAQESDTEEIKECFNEIDNLLTSVSLDVNNKIFATVCNLVITSEKRAFMDGIRIGATLMTELQE